MSDATDTAVFLFGFGNAEFRQRVLEDSDGMTVVLETLFQTHVDEILEIVDRGLLALIWGNDGSCSS